MGMVTGFAAGYYMGAKAGRQRYDEINRTLSKLRRSETVEVAAERARTVVEEGVDKARSLVDAGIEKGPDGHGDPSPGDVGLIIPASPDAPPADPGYSSSR